MSKRIAALMLLFMAAITVYSGTTFASKAVDPKADGVLKTEVKVNGYICRVYSIMDGIAGYVEIERDGVKLYSDSADIGSYWIEPFGDTKSLSDQDTGVQDITGDGIPDLVIGTSTGGAHCCTGYRIFSLGPELKEIANFPVSQTSATFEFKDLDNDSIYEITGKDHNFDYWISSYAGSPAPGIILRYKDNAYHLAMDRMKKAPPNSRDFKRMIGETKVMMADFLNGKSKLPPALLLEKMLDLIYTGNGSMALELLDQVWPEKKKGKLEFLAEVLARLSNSPYWTELKVWNGWNKW